MRITMKLIKHSHTALSNIYTPVSVLLSNYYCLSLVKSQQVQWTKFLWYLTGPFCTLISFEGFTFSFCPCFLVFLHLFLFMFVFFVSISIFILSFLLYLPLSLIFSLCLNVWDCLFSFLHHFLWFAENQKDMSFCKFHKKFHSIWKLVRTVSIITPHILTQVSIAFFSLSAQGEWWLMGCQLALAGH